jgi:hypothetical protein
MQAAYIRRKTTRVLGTRSRITGRLRQDVAVGRATKKSVKHVVDLTGNPSGPPPIAGGGPVCSWGPPRSGGIVFRVAPPDFDIQPGKGATTDKAPAGLEEAARMDKGKGKSTTSMNPAAKDRGKKKMWQL